MSATAAAAVLAFGVAQAAPLDAYGKMQNMALLTISPDGTKVAFVQQVQGKPVVVVDQLNPASVVAELPPSEQKVRALIWADATHLLVVKSTTSHVNIVGDQDEMYVAQSFDVQTRKSRPLFSEPQTSGSDNTRIHGEFRMNTLSTLPEVRTVNGRTAVFAEGVIAVDRILSPALFSDDLLFNREQVLDRAATQAEEKHWIVDDRGALIGLTMYDGAGHIWTLRLKKPDGQWLNVFSLKTEIDQPKFVGFSPDGSSLLLQMAGDDGQLGVRPVTLADGKLGERLPQYDGLSSFVRDSMTQRVVWGVKAGMEPTYVFLDPKDQAAWDAVLKSFPDEQVDPISSSFDHSKIVVRVTGLRHGIVYNVVDIGSRSVVPIGQVYSDIKPDDMADVNIASYPAKDGLPIKAFLTLPTGRDPKNLPLIVLAHGGASESDKPGSATNGRDFPEFGPADRDNAGFDWLAQGLASRGYAVLQPQFRGSTGLDGKLASAGFGEMGRKMQTDLSDGVRALAASGFIDPKRVCIVGSGYGGYAALAGVTFEQGVYRCAVAVNAASDLSNLVGASWVKDKDFRNVRALERYVGAKDTTDAVFDQISPAKHADQVNAPVLLIHGREDSVVRFDEQGVKMETALKRAKKPVDFVILEKEDHWLSREATRQQMLLATVSFLEKNNPPK